MQDNKGKEIVLQDNKGKEIVLQDNKGKEIILQDNKEKEIVLQDNKGLLEMCCNTIFCIVTNSTREQYCEQYP